MGAFATTGEPPREPEAPAERQVNTMEFSQRPTPATKVWLVTGPSAEHGDGQGVIGIRATESAARDLVYSEMRMDIEMAKDGNEVMVVPNGTIAQQWEAVREWLGWPRNTVEYSYREVTLGYLGITQDAIDSLIEVPDDIMDLVLEGTED